MKKTLLIFAGIALVCMLLVVRLFFKQHSGFTGERKWFAKALRICVPDNSLLNFLEDSSICQLP
jgi:hypothetical protein